MIETLLVFLAGVAAGIAAFFIGVQVVGEILLRRPENKDLRK
jgi:hypothetical protein